MKNFKDFHNNLYQEINKNMNECHNIQNKKFNILKSIMTNYKKEANTIKEKLTDFEENLTDFEEIDGCQISANIVELENFEDNNVKVLADMQDYFSSVNMNNFIEQSDNNFTTQELLLEDINDDFNTEQNEIEFINNLYTMDELEKELNTFN